MKQSLQIILPKAQENISSLERSDHSYSLQATLGSFYTSQYLIARQWIESLTGKLSFQLFDENIFKAKLFAEQLPDGSWYAVFDGAFPLRGDITATFFNYWYLKSSGEDINSPALIKARGYILSHGGLEKMTLFSKVFMAMFDNYSWSKIPYIPYLLFSKVSPVREKSFGQWVGPHLMPISYLRNNQIHKNLGSLFDLDELNVSQNKVENKIKKLSLIDRKIIKLMREHQDSKGLWGGYTLATILCSMSLAYDYSRSHHAENLLAIENGLQKVEALSFDSPGSNYDGVVDDGHIWDTALMTRALLESHYLQKDLKPQGELLVNRQQANGGLPFGYGFEKYPDVDDTAEVILALQKMGGYEPSILKAKNFIFKMQNKDGGWGAFSKNNTEISILSNYLSPFNDSVDFYDESSPDVTGHVLEALAVIGINKNNSELVKKAIQYLKKTQDSSLAAWEGRWGVNYLYGTAAVIVGLVKQGENPEEIYIKKATDWLLSKQNADGGFGESFQSYKDKSWAGKGMSTASQTAWVLQALSLAGYKNHPVTLKAVSYLISNFESGSKFTDPSDVGTGHPGIVYMRYPSYAYAFPLIALSEWLND